MILSPRQVLYCLFTSHRTSFRLSNRRHGVTPPFSDKVLIAFEISRLLEIKVPSNPPPPTPGKPFAGYCISALLLKSIFVFVFSGRMQMIAFHFFVFFNCVGQRGIGKNCESSWPRERVCSLQFWKIKKWTGISCGGIRFPGVKWVYWILCFWPFSGSN